MPSKTPRATRTDEQQQQDAAPAKAKRTRKSAGAELPATEAQDTVGTGAGTGQTVADTSPAQDASQQGASAEQTQPDTHLAQDAPQPDASTERAEAGAGQTFAMRIYDPSGLIFDPEIDSRDDAEYAADDPEMTELVESMRAAAETNPERVGNNQALLVRPGLAGGPDWIVAGRRRNTAAAIAGVRVVAIVREMSTKDARIAALVENINRKTISYLAEARQYAILASEHGMSQREIAAAMKGKTERSQSAVSKALTVYRMPQWVHALIQSEKLGPDVAYEGFKLFAQVPGEDFAPGVLASVWKQMETAWKTIAAHGTPTATRLKDEAALIIKRNSRSIDPTYTVNGEEAPAFDPAKHDAACTCGGATVQLQEYHRKHARCFIVEVWDRLQAEARQAHADALRATRSATPAAPRASTEAAAVPTSASAQVAAQSDAGEPQDARDVKEVRRYAEPTWTGFARDFAPNAGGLVLTGEFSPAEGAPDPVVLADWTLIPADSIQYVQAPTTPDAFRLVCTDPEALKAAKAAGEDAVRRMVDVMRGQRQAALRETAAKTDLHTAEAYAALLWAHANTHESFPAETAEMLGIELPDELSVMVGMKRSQLALVHQAIVARVLAQDTGYRDDETEDEARRQVIATFAEHFAARVAGLPVPVRLEAPQEGAPAPTGSETEQTVEAPEADAPDPTGADGEQPVEASQEGAVTPAGPEGEQPVEASQEDSVTPAVPDGEQPVEASQEEAVTPAGPEGEQPVETARKGATRKASAKGAKGGAKDGRKAKGQ